MPAIDSEHPTSGSATTLSYFDDDTPRSVSQVVDGLTKSSTFLLDATGRRQVETNVDGSSVTTLTRHYTDTSDNPSWIAKVIGSGGATITRYAPSLGEGLQTTTTGSTTSLLISNPNGDTVMTATVPSSGNATINTGFTEFDEFGKLLSPSSLRPTGAATYGWLGTAERAALSTGLILMGARLYNNVTGRFLSLDPVDGGNENGYVYPSDPVNKADATGLDWLGDQCMCGIGRINRSTAGNSGTTYSKSDAAKIIKPKIKPQTSSQSSIKKIVGALQNGKSKGKGKNIKQVQGTAELKELYKSITKGAVPMEHSTYKGSQVKLPDGTLIGRRNSDGSGSTIDVRYTDGSYWKIHTADGK